MALTSGIRGRYFPVLLKVALDFYLRHKETLDPLLESAVKSAILLLIQSLPGMMTDLNPPGPQ